MTATFSTFVLSWYKRRSQLNSSLKSNNMQALRPDHTRTIVSLTVTIVASLSINAWSQNFSRIDRETAQDMLKQVGSDVRKYYYDPTFHGIDWDAKMRQGSEVVAQTSSIATATLEIAAVLETLDDSHTFFIPPELTLRADYGWQFEMIGERCFVTQVEPDSDAEHKGLNPGDEVLTIEGFAPTRESLWKIEYALNRLRPLLGLRVELREPSGKMRRVDVQARIQHDVVIPHISDEGEFARDRARELEERLSRPRYVEIQNVMILKLAKFVARESAIQDLISKARKHSALILDLRGNPGGSESTLLDLLGGVFDKDLKIGDRVTRSKSIPILAKNKHPNIFTGKLIVLIDSRSGSAAELFARVIQIEKRGIVIGDQSSGSVMEAQLYWHHTYRGVVYGAMVATADILMTDGKSLEHHGVIPEEKVLPTATDLASHRDPVIARAAELAGANLTPQKAGTFFPYQWTKN
jgi:C-terminal processing protease CtpA/Prc